MAEGGSVPSKWRSLRVTESDTVFNFHCDPCKFGQVDSEGVGYCTVCGEYLCSNCLNAHTNSRATRGHKIVQGSELQTVEAQCPVYDFEYCSKHPGSAVEVYCKTHDEVICSECSLLEHGRCRDKQIIQDATKGTIRSSETSHFTQTLKYMTIRIQELRKESDQNIADLKQQKQKCLQKIADFRSELNKRLDVLEREARQKLSKAFSEQSQRMQDHISCLDTLSKALERNKHNLDTAIARTSDHQVFVAMKKAGLKLLRNSLTNAEQEDRTMKLDFKPFTTLKGVLEDVEYLGTCSLEPIFPKVTPTIIPSNLKDKYLVKWAEHVVKEMDDVGTGCTDISGMAITLSGDTLLCDYASCKVKLLGRDGKVKASTKLVARPWDVTVLTEDEALVSLPGKEQLQFISVPSLKPGRTLKVGKQCAGLAVDGNLIYVTCYINPRGEGEVLVMSKAGVIQRRIGRNPDGTFLFESPNYIAVDPLTEKMYVSDWQKHSLFCLTKNGKIEYTYVGMKDCTGNVMTYTEGSAYLITQDAHGYVLQVVTADGKKSRNLLTWREGEVGPQTFCFRSSDNTLLVGMNGKCSIEEYRFV